MKKFAPSIVILFASLVISVITLSEDASAYTFDRSNIISDYVFYNPNTMNANAIQTLLNNKVPVCESYTKYGGIGTPIPCLKDYRLDVPNMSADTYCAEISSGNFTAAETIAKISVACGVNPQVLLVTLQKEQSLITDTWPRDGGSCLPYWNNCGYSYRSAMGYACPDSAACDPSYYGFFNQVYYMARQWKIYKTWPNSFNYVAGRPVTIDGSTFTIQNQATAGLYNYTPHFHGNENFFIFFAGWFGNPLDNSFRRLDNPRWMQIAEPTKKVGVFIGSEVGDLLEPNRQIKFLDKVSINNEWCLRTEWDLTYGNLSCISIAKLVNIPYVGIEPTYMMSNHKDIHKYVPDKDVFTPEAKYPIGTIVKITSKITVNSTTFYRTAFDSERGSNLAFKAERLDHFGQVITLDNARVMQAKQYVVKTNPFTNSPCGSLDSSYLINIKGKFTYNNILYFTENTTLEADTTCAINSGQLNWNPIIFAQFLEPRNMRLITNTDRTDLTNGQVVDTLTAGRVIHFSSKIFVNGQWYYRTTHNTENNYPYVIPARTLE